MKEFNNLFDAIIQFEAVLFDISTIRENELWIDIFHRLNETITDEMKSILNFDGAQLLSRVREYEIRLKHYRDNYEHYDDTSSIQENDLKFTTNKYFTEVVSSFRDKAIVSLKQLKRIIRNTKNENDKYYLMQSLQGIIHNANELIDVCVIVIETYKQSLVHNLALKNIDFKEKFNLIHISMKEL